jgi:hypothetical protein
LITILTVWFQAEKGEEEEEEEETKKKNYKKKRQGAENYHSSLGSLLSQTAISNENVNNKECK